MKKSLLAQKIDKLRREKRPCIENYRSPYACLGCNSEESIKNMIAMIINRLESIEVRITYLEMDNPEWHKAFDYLKDK